MAFLPKRQSAIPANANDTITGGTGADSIIGGDGDDVLLRERTGVGSSFVSSFAHNWTRPGFRVSPRLDKSFRNSETDLGGG